MLTKVSPEMSTQNTQKEEPVDACSRIGLASCEDDFILAAAGDDRECRS
jgi:hypothetical protein